MPINISELMPLIIAVCTAIIAVIKYIAENQEKKTIIEMYTDPVVAESNPEILCKLPPRSYIMNADLRKNIGESESAEDRILIHSQIDAAERAGKVKYEIHYSKGYYIIEYGLIAESGRGK